jgi:hypothetical protein
MPRGLPAPLSPQEEIALRRIAHGSMRVDGQAASRLIAVALIQRTSSGLHLTPLGRLRFDALPKAPLLAPQRSARVMTGYVEGLIDKAQARAALQAAGFTPPLPPAPIPVVASLLPEVEDTEHGPDQPPIYLFLGCEHWQSRAVCALVRTRRAIMEHRQRQVRLCDASDRRIESSRALLKESVPIRSSCSGAAG